MKNEHVKSILWVLLGSALLSFLGWRWNVPAAAWLAPIFLMRFFRTQTRWQTTLLVVPVMTLGLFINLTGSWDFTVLEEIGLSLGRALPLFIALVVDRAFYKKMGPLPASLLFPAVLVVLDFGIAFSPLGTVFSIGATQFANQILLQITSLTGVWGLTFLIGWFASLVNLAWQSGFQLRTVRGPVGLAAALIAALLIWGGVRLFASEPASSTVRIAGVTVEHTHDYYGEIIDHATPRDLAASFEEVTRTLTNDLFTQTERAVESGAKIIFWSEGSAILYPENKAAFIQRGQAFAKEHGVYLIPAYIVLRYGEATADNQLMIIAPDGEIAYEYTKTKSWYPTDSDGILPVIATPYGNLSASICFDMDFPGFVHQVAGQHVDIMVVPSYDWEPIKPYHTEVGLFRGVENGFSVVRHVNQGTSMAIDYNAQVLAYQDYFDTDDHLMVVDVPTKGVRTVYGLLGDWFAYACILYVAGSIFGVLVAGKMRRRSPNGLVQPIPKPLS